MSKNSKHNVNFFYGYNKLYYATKKEQSDL